MSVPSSSDAELLERFLEHEAAVAGLAPATVRNRGIYLRTFLRWWADQRPVRPMSSAATCDLAAFLVAEAARGMAARTRKAQIASLRRLYAWLELTGHTTMDPARALPSPRVAPLDTEVYRPDEVEAILRHTASLTDLRGRQRHVIVATLRFTGMRSGELRTLRTDRLQLDAARARVVGKGARPRTVLLPVPLVQLLGRFLDEVRPQLPPSPLLLANAHPFVTTRHRGFGQEALAREVELAGEGAGVRGRHFPHRWRHTYATELVRGGVDIHVVQRLLGHASIASTVGYTHLELDDLQAVIGSRWPDAGATGGR
jgi:site-specific recombinase XerD